MIILFDFDGVIVDTESQYTIFWDKMGKEYLGAENFGMTIKGQTLKQIFGKYFDGMLKEQEEIVPQLDSFESQMSYEYMPGFLEFITEIKSACIPTAIVTSSNDDKMAHAFRTHPELPELVDAILTSEHFSKSKPDPECFIKGMEVLKGTPESTIVFEDSLHGVNAGRASGTKVIGLATTNKSEVLTPLCDMVINDFTEISLKDITALLQQ
ncbi:MAG: HAD family phosphatase [Bacteroidales bacterium]|nr:HAD family phosphatase [Bacteroidales bacterium]